MSEVGKKFTPKLQGTDGRRGPTCKGGTCSQALQRETNCNHKWSLLNPAMVYTISGVLRLVRYWEGFRTRRVQGNGTVGKKPG